MAPDREAATIGPVGPVGLERRSAEGPCRGQGEHEVTQRLAADCRYLRRTIDTARADGPLVCLCQHPVRAGLDCVGPFLEDLPTRCGLWERVGPPPAAGTGGLPGRR